MLLQVSITFPDADALGLDKCTSVTDTGITHNQRQTSSMSDTGGKVTEETVAGMLHVTQTSTLYKQTTQY